VRNKNQSTALHVAAQNDNIRGVKLIIEAVGFKKAILDAQNSDGNSALHLAVKAMSQEICQLLLERGTDVNIQNHEGQTALHLAVENLFTWISAQLSMCQLLLEKGANVNIQNHKGQTVLHIANHQSHSNRDWFDMMEVLLQSNPDQSLLDCNGLTAVDLVMNSNINFRKFYFGMDWEWTRFRYSGKEDLPS